MSNELMYLKFNSNEVVLNYSLNFFCQTYKENIWDIWLKWGVIEGEGKKNK